MTIRTTAAFVAIALTTLLATSCGSDDTDEASASRTTTTSVVAATTTSVVAAPADSLPGEAAPDTVTAAPVQPAPQSESNGGASTPAQPVSVPCVDPSSAVVQDAIASLWADHETGWTVTDHTPGTSAEGCPTISWAVADGTAIGDATYVSHVMFFHKEGRYIGRASGTPYSYTSVVGSTDTSVDVRYNWLTGDDAFCCPTGGPSVLTFEYDGVTMVPRGDTGHFPPSQP